MPAAGLSTTLAVHGAESDCPARSSEVLNCVVNSSGSAVGVGVEVGVDVIEPMGAQSVLYLSVGNDTLVASVDSATTAREDEKLPIVLDMNKAHIFDKETETAIAEETIK